MVMAFEPLIGILSSLLSINGIISLLINVIITTAIIAIISRLIAHESNIKHCFIMSFVSYLVVPLIVSYLIIFAPGIGTVSIILPLIIWIILGEALLNAGRKQNLIIAVIAYAINLLLLSYVTSFIFSFL